MFQRLRAYLTRHIVTEVPNEIAACMECGAVQCVEGKFRNCPNRLARVAALNVMQAEADQKANAAP
jgi:hypothetical protein